MKAIIYIRVSSDEQVKGTSLESQEQLCREYCERRGWDISEVFREEGESAKTADRTELLRALDHCRVNRGRVGHFIVAKLDRFARNAEDHILVRKQLSGYGVTLHSVSEPIGEGPSGRFIEMVLAASSEFDNAVRRQRCTDGMAAKLRQGIYPWKPPIGYSCASNKKHGRKKTEPDAPHPQVFPIIVSALKRYLSGDIRTQTEFRDLLDSLGLAEIRGRRTPLQTVDLILGHYLPFYAGILVDPWTEEERPGRHQPMITREEMHQIRLIRAGKARPKTPRNRRNPDFPLRGTLRCAACGHTLTGSASRGNGGRYLYYHCYMRACPRRGKTFPKEEVEMSFLQELERLAVSKPFLRLLSDTLKDGWEEMFNLRTSSEASRSQAIAELESKRRRVFELREDSSYTPQMFRERLKAVDDGIASLRLAPTLPSVPTKEEVLRLLSDAEAVLVAPNRHWQTLPAHARPMFQRQLFPVGILVDDHGVLRTTEIGLPFELNRQFVSTNSTWVHPRVPYSEILAYLQQLIAIVSAKPSDSSAAV